MSLNISLPAELENRVRDHVASGMYVSASEVIREALRLFETYQAGKKLESESNFLRPARQFEKNIGFSSPLA